VPSWPDIRERAQDRGRASIRRIQAPLRSVNRSKEQVTFWCSGPTYCASVRQPPQSEEFTARWVDYRSVGPAHGCPHGSATRPDAASPRRMKEMRLAADQFNGRAEPPAAGQDAAAPKNHCVSRKARGRQVVLASPSSARACEQTIVRRYILLAPGSITPPAPGPPK